MATRCNIFVLVRAYFEFPVVYVLYLAATNCPESLQPNVVVPNSETLNA